ncbi:MAG: murein biosynthesis integral membrane protein MurJ, partial [Myxococcota bacterium]
PTMRGALPVAVANLLARVTGMLREIVVSAVFGATAATDALNAALRVPQLLRELLAEGSLQNAFVPAFSEAQEKEGVEDAWRLANALLGVLLCVLGGATLVFLLGAPLWVKVVAAGFEPDKEALAATLTRWLAPFLAGLSLAGFAGAMLNVRGRFFVPALAGNVLNLLVIAGALLAPQFARVTGQPPIVAVAVATTLSGFAQAALCWPALAREGYRVRPTLAGHPALKKMLRWLGPAIVGIATVQVNLLIETQWASAYGDGTLTWLVLSFRLVQLPLAVVSGSVATAALAALSAHHARGETDGFGDALARALRANTLWVLPSAVGLGVLAEPLTRLFFERGAFGPADTAGTAAMLQMYAFAVFGICFHRVAVPVYYALGDPRTPMRLSVLAMLAKVPVILALTRGLGLGAEALPLSHALTVTGEGVALAWGFRGHLAGRGILRHHAKVAVACVALGGVAFALRDQHVIVACAGAGLVYLALAAGLGLLERRDRLPPFLDAPSRAAMQAVAGGAAVADGVLHTPAGAWRLVARDGALAFEPHAGDPLPAGRASVAIVVRVGPLPSMRGLEVGGRVWHADGDVVVEGACAGPRIPVS